MRQRALAIFFAIWLAGVQVAELFAVVGCASVALVLIAELVRERRRPKLTGDVWLLIAFLFAAVFFPLLSGATPGGTGLARLLALAAIPVAAAAAAKLTEQQLRAALIAGGVTLLVSCFAAGLQHFGAWPSWESMQKLEALKLPIARVYEEVPGAQGRFMAGGLLFHRLKFAHVSGLAVIGGAAVALAAKGRARMMAGLIAAVGLVSVLWFPFARAAAVALVGALGLLVALVAARESAKARRGIVVAGVAVLLAFAAAVAFNEPLRARLLRSESEEGSGGRVYLLQAGMTALRSHPLTGIGVGRFKAADYVAKDAPTYVTEHQGKTHNQLLSLAVESGVPAALLFVAFLVALAMRLWRAPPSGLASLAFFAALAVLHDPLFHAEFGLALALALGVPLGLLARPAHRAQ